MRLREFEGKKLFRRYKIPVPRGMVLHRRISSIALPAPLVVKAQVYFGERQKSNAILFARNKKEVIARIASLLGREIRGEKVKKILLEERIASQAEYYVSISYDTDIRGPTLALSSRGGSGIKKASLFPIDILIGLPDFFVRSSLLVSGFPKEDINGILSIVQNLWSLFIKEHALLAEINPLIKTRDNRFILPPSRISRVPAMGMKGGFKSFPRSPVPHGKVGGFIAVDAKVVLDDEKLKPGERRFLNLGGDIAILASGGGASLVNIDALLHFGGRPANYTEYSGNPPAQVVKELTKRVLSQEKIKGCWVVGGTANFTDIFETMRGFLEGLRELKSKPTFPIVIRRDGPRQKEAFEMLKKAAVNEGYQFHLFGSETPMSESAKIMIKLAYGR